MHGYRCEGVIELRNEDRRFKLGADYVNFWVYYEVDVRPMQGAAQTVNAHSCWLHALRLLRASAAVCFGCCVLRLLRAAAMFCMSRL